MLLYAFVILAAVSKVLLPPEVTGKIYPRVQGAVDAPGRNNKILDLRSRCGSQMTAQHGLTKRQGTESESDVR